MGLKILIADDDSLSRSLLSKLIVKLGAESFPAENGQRAYEMCIAEDFDAVFLDINMPVMSGEECAEKLSEYYTLNGSKQPLTVCISADDIYVKSPLFDYALIKPFRTEDIQRFLDAAGICAEDISYDFDVVTNKIGLDKETMTMLLGEFFSVMDEELINLKKAIGDTRPDMITHVSHKMKGAAAGMMIIPLQTLCSQLQSSDKSEINSVKLLFIRINCYYSRFKALFTP